MPDSPLASVDVRITFGSLPAWLPGVSPKQIETSFVAEYTDECGNPALRVFRLLDGKYHRFCYADRTEFVINDKEIWAKWSEPLTIEDTATYLLGPVMGFVLLLRGLVCLHASAIAVGDEAIALAGPAGSGKSTTAAAFANQGFSVLAEDVVTLDERGGEFFVRPAYPCIRLWPPAVEALYGVEAQLPKLTPNWEKCYLDLGEKFVRKPLPLAAIYLLGQRSDELVIYSIDRAEGLMSLVANTYATKLMEKDMRAREFGLLTRVLNSVPLRRVTPHRDPARIPELCESIVNDFKNTFPAKAQRRKGRT